MPVSPLETTTERSHDMECSGHHLKPSSLMTPSVIRNYPYRKYYRLTFELLTTLKVANQMKQNLKIAKIGLPMLSIPCGMLQKELTGP